MTSRPAEPTRWRVSRRRGERALVLARLVREEPSPGTASSGPGRRRSGHRRRPRPIRRTRRCSSAPWNAASWWTIRSVPGVTYVLTRPARRSARTRRRAGHWKSVQTSSVTGASALPSVRPSASATGVGLAGVVRAAASAVVGPPRAASGADDGRTPKPPTIAVISSIGDRRGRRRWLGARGRPAAAFGASARGVRPRGSSWSGAHGMAPRLAMGGRLPGDRSPRRNSITAALGRRRGPSARIRWASRPARRSRRGDVLRLSLNCATIRHGRPDPDRHRARPRRLPADRAAPVARRPDRRPGRALHRGGPRRRGARRAASGSGGRRSSGRSRSSRSSAPSSGSTCRPASTPTSAASRPTTTTSSARAAAGRPRSTTPACARSSATSPARPATASTSTGSSCSGVCPACLGAQAEPTPDAGRRVPRLGRGVPLGVRRRLRSRCARSATSG